MAIGAGTVGLIALVGAVLGGHLSLLGVAIVEGLGDLIASQGCLPGGGGRIFVVLDVAGIPSGLAGALVCRAVGSQLRGGHPYQHEVASSDLGGGGAGNIVLGPSGFAIFIGRAGGVFQGIGHNIVILGRHVQINRGGPTGGSGSAPPTADGSIGKDVGDVNGLLFAALGLFDGVVAVLHHDDGVHLGFHAVSQGRLGAVGGADSISGVIGVLKQIQPHSHKDVLIGAILHQFERILVAQVRLDDIPGLGHVVQVVVAARLGQPQANGSGQTFGNSVILHAPATAATVREDAPIRDNETSPAGTKQSVELKLRETAANDLTQGFVLGVGDGIVGHDATGGLGGTVGQIESTVMEGNEVGLEVVVGEHRILSVGAVVIAASLRSAGTGIVLHDSNYGVTAPALVGGAVPGGLHTGDPSFSHVTIQGGIFAVGTGTAIHDGGSHQVNLGAQQHVHAGGAVLFGVLLARLKGRVGIHHGSQGVLLGNAGLAVGVDGHYGGDAEVQALARLLNQVDPDGVVHVVLSVGTQVTGNTAPATASNIGITRVVVTGKYALVGGKGAPAAVGQVGGDLLAAHLVGQVAGAGLVVQPPVLIGVQRAVAVQVLEGEAAGLEQLHAGLLGVAQGGAALVGHFDPAVGSGLLFPLHVAGAQFFQVAGLHHRGGAPRLAAVVGRCARWVRGAGLAGRQAQDHGQRQQRGGQLFHFLHPRCSPFNLILSSGNLRGSQNIALLYYRFSF